MVCCGSGRWSNVKWRAICWVAGWRPSRSMLLLAAGGGGADPRQPAPPRRIRRPGSDALDALDASGPRRRVADERAEPVRRGVVGVLDDRPVRSEEHTSELQSH